MKRRSIAIVAASYRALQHGALARIPREYAHVGEQRVASTQSLQVEILLRASANLARARSNPIAHISASVIRGSPFRTLLSQVALAHLCLVRGPGPETELHVAHNKARDNKLTCYMASYPPAQHAACSEQQATVEMI